MEPEVQASDADAFRSAVAVLQDFNSTAPRLLGANFGVAIAVLMHRKLPGGRPEGSPPPLVARPDSGDPISTGDLQVAVCDQTYAKAPEFLPSVAEGPIYKPFTDSFKERSPGNNNWRNSFDLQGGLGCDAPYTPEYLQSPVYLSERRFDCPFRDRDTGYCASPSGYADADRTCFNPNKRAVPPGPETKAQHRPKLLTRGSLGGDHGYWYIEPTLDVLADLLASPDRRVPLYPFVAAVYGGSPYFATWGDTATRSRFEADIGLDAERFSALFDPDPASELNASFLSGNGKPAKPSAALSPPPPLTSDPSLSEPVPFKVRQAGGLTMRAGAQSDPAKRARLLERARRGHQRALEALAAHLKDQGNFALTEQLDGYDLLAIDAGVGYLFEVKTWTPANLGAQVRRGWAQLREYRYRNRKDLPADVRLYLVLDRPPPGDSWAWRFLVEDCDVVPAWIHKGALTTLPEFRKSLP